MRWATCQADSDPSSISGMWFGGRTPSSKEAISARADSKKTLLVLDEAQQSSDRHSKSIQEMLEACSGTSAAVLVVTRAPNPFTGMSGFESIRLEGLEPSMARPLLPEEMGKRRRWRSALQWMATPLESRLWSPDDDLPGAGAVQEYVESGSKETYAGRRLIIGRTLTFSTAPRSGRDARARGGRELDDSAILRWAGHLVEPHHLVRNVRRATLEGEEQPSFTQS